MIRSAALKGCIDEKSSVLEAMYCFKRAGCDGIITYFAPYIAKKMINKVL